MARQGIPETELEFLPQKGVRRSKLVRLAAQGFSAYRAAQIMGCSNQTVLTEYRDPEFKKQVLGLVEAAFESSDVRFGEEMFTLQDRIRMKAEEAFETLCEMMDDSQNEPGVRAKIAMDMLNRVPETQTGHQVRTGPIEDAQVLARAARAAQEINNVIPFRKEEAS